MSYVNEKYVYLVCDGISARIRKETEENLRIKELAHIRKGIQGYNLLFPQENVLDISFDDLTPENFEVFSEVLLTEMGYYNSHLMGNTRSSDGGVDIVAYKDVEDKEGEKHKEKWLIQCKHYKSGIPIKRADISEIPDLLTENNAKKYMLLSTKQLSAQVCKRIDTVNEGQNGIIEFYSGTELKILVTGFPDIVKRFELKIDNH